MFTDWVVSVGIWQSALGVTAFSVAISIIAAGTMLRFTAGDDVPLIDWLPAAILVPPIIAPMVTSALAGMAHELAKAKAALAEIALTDPLTGVANRRLLVVQADLEIARTRRMGTNLSLLVIDVDHFKAVNDTYGHGVGDQVLQAVADICGQTLRSGDLFARIGGEEFAVLLPMTSVREAARVAETVRAAIENLELDRLGAGLSITASIGVAGLARRDDGLRELLDEADQQLYFAKNSGRNRVGVELPSRFRTA